MGFLSRLFGSSKSQPRVLAHVAFDGAIRVIETPTSDGWKIAEDHRSGDGFTVRVLKYVLPLQPMPLALLAKIYTSAEAPPEPASTDWRTTFQALFSSFTNVETTATTQLTMTASLPATQAIIDGIGAEPAVEIRIRERRAVLGTQQFIVTAMGDRSAFEQHAVEIEQWFSTCAFVP